MQLGMGQLYVKNSEYDMELLLIQQLDMEYLITEQMERTYWECNSWKGRTQNGTAGSGTTGIEELRMEQPGMD
jgi:hypothetical protein